MMVNFSAMLKDARRGRYAVGSFNVYNYETIRGVIEAGQQLGYPTIVAFGEAYLSNMGLDDVFAVVSAIFKPTACDQDNPPNIEDTSRGH
jgi:fructose/tagatose bisphosphate aldolase